MSSGGAGSPPRVSIVVPLVEDRGHGIECVESWTRRQQCDPASFELIALYRPRDREMISVVEGRLRPRDRLVECDTTNVMELCKQGAEIARGDILFFTEWHCIADPCNVREIIETFDNDASVDGFTARGDSIVFNELGRLEGLYFDDYARKRADPRRWDKVSLRGFAVKRSAYFAAGAFQTQFDSFAERLLAADMHRRGMKVGYVPQVGVRHVNTNSFATLNEAIRDFVHGECLFLETVDDPDSWRDYFKPSPECDDAVLTKRRRDAATSILRGVARQALSGRLRRAVPAAVARHLPAAMTWDGQLHRQRARVLSARLGYYGWRASPNRRVQSFFRYWDGLADLYRIRWFIEREPRSSLTGKRTETFGFHEPEYHENSRIRWSQAVAGIQIPDAPGHYTAVLRSPPIRGFDRDDGLMFCMNGMLIDAAIDREAGEIRISLEPGHFRPTGPNWLYMSVRPWRSASANGDDRNIGLPLSEIRLEPADVSGAPRIAWQFRF